MASKDFLAFGTDGSIKSLDGKLVRNHGTIVDAAMLAAIRATLGVPASAEGLVPSQNLADLENVVTALVNLGVYSKADVNDRTNARQPANGVYYNGSSSFHSISHASALDFGTGDLTVAVRFWLDAIPTSAMTLVTSRGAGSSGFQVIAGSWGGVDAYLSDGTNSVGASNDGNSLRVGLNTAVVVFDRSANLSRYVNEELTGTEDSLTSVTGSVTSSQAVTIGKRNTSEYFDGYISELLILNRAMSSAEALRWAIDGGVPVADQSATNATQTSGTLTSGARYRIDTFVSGDDFTNVGAASNATGVEFVATGTTPTTYSNGSTLRSIGGVVQLFPENIESDGSIVDASSNELNAAATNVAPLRTKPQVSGTFTPQLYFGATLQTVGSAVGSWWKDGVNPKIINYTLRISAPSAVTDVGNAVVSALPFNTANDSNKQMVQKLLLFNGTGLTGAALAGLSILNTDDVNLYQTTSTGLTPLTNADFTTSSVIYLTGTIETA
jgi:hypothetical protein